MSRTLAAVNAMTMMLQGNYQGMIDAYRGIEWLRPKDKHLLTTAYATLGYFHRAYSLVDPELLEYTGNNDPTMQLLFVADILFESLPFFASDDGQVQSDEEAGASYRECGIAKLLNGALQAGDAEQIVILRRTVNEMLNHHDSVTRAQGFFTCGEHHFMARNYPGSLCMYSNAIWADPGKALYWGYYAQALLRVASSNTEKMSTGEQIRTALEGSSVAAKAIELQPTNARWHLHQAHWLIRLGIKYNGQFFDSALGCIDKARQLATQSQSDVSEAAQSLKENIEKLRSLLDLNDKLNRDLEGLA